jgi:hypothetical protein
MHVWNIIDGDIYVSKNGDDVTGDGSMALPYASINKATDVGVDGDKIVIGTGLWQEARGTSTNKYQFIGDGQVVFDYSGGSYFLPWLNLITGSDTIESIIINNDGVDLAIYNTSSRGFVHDSDKFPTYINCHIDNIGINQNTTAYKSVFVNAKGCKINTIEQKYNVPNKYFNLYLTNCTVFRFNFPYAVHAFIQYYKFINTILHNYEVQLANNQIITQLCAYNLISVVASNANVSYLDSTNYLGLDPKYNNEAIGDYTLKPNSPCLFAGKNNSTIGAYGLGYSFDANSLEFTKEGGAVFSQTTSVDDIVRTSQTINGITRFLFQMSAGHASGNIESAWIDLQAIRYLLITRIFANLIYNASGVATSRPDNLEAAGEKAVYYDFDLKFCNEESEKAAATFKNVIWNKAVTIDNSDRGNADPAFVASEAKYISARFVKIKLYMTEA